MPIHSYLVLLCHFIHSARRGLAHTTLHSYLLRFTCTWSLMAPFKGTHHCTPLNPPEYFNCCSPPTDFHDRPPPPIYIYTAIYLFPCTRSLGRLTFDTPVRTTAATTGDLVACGSLSRKHENRIIRGIANRGGKFRKRLDTVMSALPL